MLKTQLFIILILISACSCRKDEIPVIPGSFSLKFVENNDTITLDNSNDTFYLDLDTIKNNKSFDLILCNIGNEPITDITITPDNPNFMFSRWGDYLPGVKNNIIKSKVVKLNVLHNTDYTGISPSDLLEPGNNICIVTIEGLTKSGGIEKNIRVYIKVKTYAKLMSVGFWYKGHNYITASLLGGLSVDFLGPYLSVALHFYQITYPVVLENTGNVPIVMTLFRYNDVFNVVLESVQNSKLYPHDTITLSLPKENLDYNSLLKLDSEGVSFDNYFKISPGSDSCAYVLFNPLYDDSGFDF